MRSTTIVEANAPALELLDFYLIFVPFGLDDEPEILRYEITHPVS
jgi:hypothetical protein